MTITALIVAAGKGERAGGELPKQYQLLGGISLIAHAVDSFRAHQSVDRIMVVIGEGQKLMLDEALDGRAVDGIVIGGAERQDSVRGGLDAMGAGEAADLVLIHDAARPFVPVAVIDRLLTALETHDGAVPALPVVDTLAMAPDVLGDVVPRQALVRIQTPQAFRHTAIRAAHLAWTGPPATDDAQVVRAAGYGVAIVEGDTALEKITQNGDIARAETVRTSKMISRTGMGFDVHRLETGEQLWLCGVLIAHDRGLAGHSDADVALHALTDAILGAISEGDIGTHFPPSDPQWRGAPSTRFLEHARVLVANKGGIIDHVDLTLICEAPRIGPHRDAMRASVAALLQVHLDAVSIKATTTERLGFTGREEGIAAQAIATVRI